MTENLEIAKIRRDGGTQPRSRLFDETVDSYAEDLVNGAQFPDVVVFYDGEEYWLADGFHRIAAYIKCGFTEIGSKIIRGTRREAVLYSVGANAEHGRRRNSADMRRSVITLLSDAEWAKWSNVEIARQCKVSEKFVRAVKNEVTTLSSSHPMMEDLEERFGVPSSTFNQARKLIEQGSNVRMARRGDSVYPMDLSGLLGGQIQQSSESSEGESSKVPDDQVLPGKRQRVKGRKERFALDPQQKAKSKVKPIQAKPGNSYGLGKKNILYCGSFTDKKFINQLPLQIPLMLAYPRNFADIAPQSIPPGVRSIQITISQLEPDETDFKLMRESQQIAIDLFTEAGDPILIGNLPEPALLFLIEALEGYFLCAEPDPEQCDLALDAWVKGGGKISKVQG